MHDLNLFTSASIFAIVYRAHSCLRYLLTDYLHLVPLYTQKFSFVMNTGVQHCSVYKYLPICFESCPTLTPRRSRRPLNNDKFIIFIYLSRIRVLRWFGHVERMDEYRLVRRVLMSEGSVMRGRGRPRLGRMDGVKVALGSRGMTVQAARRNI